jgi:hypothetical protein
LKARDRCSRTLLLLLLVVSAVSLVAATPNIAAAEGGARIINPPPDSVLPGPTVRFVWTPVEGTSEYWLRVGTTHDGGEVYNGSQGTNTSVTVSGLPVNGETIHVRLSWRIKNVWRRNAYRYIAFRESPPPTPPPSPPPGGSRWVSGYYAGWFWNWYPPAVVDMTAMTHFIFGRYAPGGGTLGGNPGDVIPGAGTGHDPSVEQFLINKGHTVGVKSLMMLGGVGDGPGFDASTVNPTIRKKFIDNILARLDAKDYDGVDIDWEENLSTPAQQAQVLALLSELRIAGNKHPQFLPPHAPIIVTWPAFWANINFKTVGPWHVKVAALVDQYNLMTYSMAGIWPGWDSWHHSALSDAQPNHPTSIEASINEYVAAGVPKKKLGVGIGFYGLYYSNGPVNAPRMTPGNSKLEGADVENAYMELVKDGAFNQPSGKIKWDSAAKQAYVTYSPAWKRYPQTSIGYLSFEDEQSIAAKGQYIKANGIGGSMIWVINYGCTNANNGDNPLLAAAKAALK